MSEPDIKRATELFLVRKLTLLVPPVPPTHRFVSFMGGSETADAQEIEPPVTVVAMGEPEKQFAQELTWRIKGTLQVINHRAYATSNIHSLLVRSVMAGALAIAAPAQEGLFYFHGLDVEGIRSTEDAENKLHADIIDIVVGVSG